MMRKLLISAATLVVAAGVLALGVGQAHAALIQGSFTGKVVGITDSGGQVPGGITFNDPVNGSFQYESTAPDTCTSCSGVNSAFNGIYNNANGLMGILSVTISHGSNSFTWTSGSTLQAQVLNDFTTIGDKFALTFKDSGTSFPNPLGNSNVTLQLLDNSSPTGLTSSIALPTSLSDLDLSQLTNNPNQTVHPGFFGTSLIQSFNGTGFAPSTTKYQVLWAMNSFTLGPATPEPGTLLLIGSGLVGIGVGARKRKRRRVES